MTRPSTLVWIDAREAIIVGWKGDWARLERVESDVPAHHRATGHVRHDPGIRHGGGASPQDAGEPRRLEHLERFVEDIADRLAPDDDLLIIGSGTVHERLDRHVRESDAHHGRHRTIVCEASRARTERQLIARLRAFAGVESRRHTVGAYRWSEPPAHLRSGQAQPAPRRVVEKPRHERSRAPIED